MNNEDFYYDLKTDEEKFSEDVAAAEHLVRLKIQSGQQSDRDVDLEIEKQADFEEEHGIPKDDAVSRLKKRFKKTAGVMDLLNKHRVNPIMLGLMGGGAALNGVNTYLGSRPKEQLEGRSSNEVDLESAVQSQNTRPEGGFLDKVNRRRTELKHGLSKAFRDHPVKGALLGAGTGALGGATLGKIMGMTLRMKKGI
jgi:hypothetical protein